MNNYRNDALLAGHLVENFEFHHRNGTQKIFEGKMEVERKSGKKGYCDFADARKKAETNGGI